MRKIKLFAVFTFLLGCNTTLQAHPSSYDKVYVCTLHPFNNVIADVGISEEIARYKVQRRCEQSQGKKSIFCQPSEAKCVISSLFSITDDRVSFDAMFGSDIPALIIYSEKNQRGSKLKITQNEPDLTLYQFDDSLSSFYIPAGWKVRFYEGKNYTGNFYTRENITANAIDFNNKTSSIEILRTSY